MSKPSITDHERQFAGWPTLPTAGGAYMPARDGDIAQLEELSERVFDAIKDGAAVSLEFAAAEVGTLICGDYGWPIRWHFDYRYWPNDRAAEQLAVWRAQLDGIA